MVNVHWGRKTCEEDFPDSAFAITKRGWAVGLREPNSAVSRSEAADLVGRRDEWLKTEVGKVVEDDIIVEIRGNVAKVDEVHTIEGAGLLDDKLLAKNRDGGAAEFHGSFARGAREAQTPTRDANKIA